VGSRFQIDLAGFQKMDARFGVSDLVEKSFGAV